MNEFAFIGPVLHRWQCIALRVKTDIQVKVFLSFCLFLCLVFLFHPVPINSFLSVYISYLCGFDSPFQFSLWYFIFLILSFSADYFLHDSTFSIFFVPSLSSISLSLSLCFSLPVSVLEPFFTRLSRAFAI